MIRCVVLEKWGESRGRQLVRIKLVAVIASAIPAPRAARVDVMQPFQERVPLRLTPGKVLSIADIIRIAGSAVERNLQVAAGAVRNSYC
jgi:hypothetical protein